MVYRPFYSTQVFYHFSACIKVAVSFFLLLIFFAAPAESQLPDHLGHEYYQKHQYDSAVILFTKFIDTDSANKEGWFNRGLCYYQLNNLNDALLDFDRALVADSSFADARFMQVLTLQNMGRWPRALSSLKKLDTSYAGYNELKKRIFYHQLSVSISRKWYYMIAIMFLFVVLVGVLVKSWYTVKS